MAADAASATFLSILLSLTITLSLVSPSLAMYCHSQIVHGIPFPYPTKYSNCTEYLHHKAALHYTFDPANSSLSLAFAATPPSSGGWVAWAINPTSTGMVGAQALMALKTSTGSVVAKTFNISSHHSVVESELSFDVWDLSAHEASDGTMWLFATVKLCRRSLNLVWQVGGVVNGTRPGIHQMAFANKNAKATLELGA
ncbi:auxin-induced in root cultures protein 12 [Eucalyptus grandis]|uniref:auxin-induced in root cultures protein 12 n=1 Tax=Eucalyptus grandis TaxID=71139 RepID=UPI00192E924D|nr:auxin-induced in root cultures protein 12 [Eucalyptus grandis]